MTTEGARKALALGSGITLLGVMRALADVGADVMALPDADPMARRSRRFKAGPRALTALSAETLAGRLSNLPAQTVLFPCSDMWARAIAALPDEVRSVYPASIAPLEALDTLIDKGRFRAVLEKLGVPHPITRNVSSPGDLDGIPEEILRSSFLKPNHSQEFFARFGVKAFRIGSRDEASDRLETCIAAGVEMMLQEYIPGPPTNHYFIDGFIDRDGVVRAMFARRRLRMNPPDFGNSTLMESIQPAEVEDAAAVLRKLLSHLRFRGIFSAEFKKDARTGVYNIIEVNARPWWYVEFAARCGVNVCALALADALGERVETISGYATGRRCVFPYYDLDAVRNDIRAGKTSFVGWARSWIGAYQPVFRWTDPMPAIGDVTALMSQRLRKKRR